MKVIMELMKRSKMFNYAFFLTYLPNSKGKEKTNQGKFAIKWKDEVVFLFNSLTFGICSLIEPSVLLPIKILSSF